MADPENWVDPLRGYAYDSFNRDALLNLAKVEKGRIVLPGGANYGLLVVPGIMKMTPDGNERMSVELAQKLLDLVNQGATILLTDKPDKTLGLQLDLSADQKLQQIVAELFSGEKTTVADALGGQFVQWKKGNGRIIQGPYEAATFGDLGILKDFVASGENGKQTDFVAWNHRKEKQKDIYFVANQLDEPRTLELTFRIANRMPELYNPVTNETRRCTQWKTENGQTRLTYRFEPNESLFVIFNGRKKASAAGQNWVETASVMELSGEWMVQFDPAFGGPTQPVNFDGLTDWSKNPDIRIRYYSGTATYSKSFLWEKQKTSKEAVWLELGSFANMAEVKVNGHPCGVCWTAPFRIRIEQALKPGENKLEIAVTNTWANRIMGDHNLPEKTPVTWTTAPYRLEGKPLLPAGLFGPVGISREVKNN